MHFITPLRLRLDDSTRDDASFNESICDYRDDPQDDEGDFGIRGMEMHEVGQEGVNGGPPLA